MKILVLAMLVGLAATRPASASLVDYEHKTITFKIVYYGPGLLKENLQYIFDRTKTAEAKQVELSAADRNEHESYWFLPVQLGEIRGFTVHVKLYTVPQGSGYREARRSILDGADGIVFVAAASPKAANEASLRELEANLATLHASQLAIAFEVSGAIEPPAAEALKKALRVGDRPFVIAVPAEGVGVFDALKAISKIVLTELAHSESTPK